MVKDINTIAQNWTQGARTRGPQAYAAGVRGKGNTWLQNTQAAEQNYVSAVTQAAQEGRHAQGVAAAGPQAWEQGAATVGAQNYANGVSSAQAQSKYVRNFTPIHGAMVSAAQSTTRGTTMSEQNFARQRAVATAAHQASRSSLGAAAGYYPTGSKYGS